MPKRKKVPIIVDELREWTQPIGVVVGTHGLKGAVKVRPLHYATEQALAVGSQVCLVLPSGRRQKLTVQSCVAKGSLWIVRFAEMTDINEVEPLVGLQLTVPQDWQPPLAEDEFLLSELQGMQVVTEEGELVGTVQDVLESPAHDLLVVEGGLIPMVKDFVKSIDRKQRRIVVRLPKGLLSEEVSPKGRRRWQK